MADFITQPDDVTALIAEHLTAQELVIFKMICQKFNRIGSHYAFLQPLYNRLRALDSSLPSVLNPDKAVLQVKHAYEKISKRQKEEIDFLKSKRPCNRKHSIQLAQLTQLDVSDQTILNLEKQHVILQEFNATIIDAAINNAIQNAEDPKNLMLNLNRAGITRFFIPEHHKVFLPNLRRLMIDNNLLTTINVKDFTALTSLWCHANASSIRINMENCAALETIHFLHKAAIDINIKGASQYAQDCFLEMETKLLFKQLSEATAPEEGHLIARLGNRYTVANCYTFGCPSHISRIVQDSVCSAFNTTVNNYFPMFANSIRKVFYKTEDAPENSNTKKHKPNI